LTNYLGYTIFYNFNIFFILLQRKIESLGNLSVIIGGDWNVPLDYSMDTLNYMHKNIEKSTKTNSLYDGAA
jgi:hypothetical protein